MSILPLNTLTCPHDGHHLHFEVMCGMHVKRSGADLGIRSLGYFYKAFCAECKKEFLVAAKNDDEPDVNDPVCKSVRKRLSVQQQRGVLDVLETIALGNTDPERMIELAKEALDKVQPKPDEHAQKRKEFESLNHDSFGFARSARGTYKNPAIARDWKWFLLGSLSGGSK